MALDAYSTQQWDDAVSSSWITIQDIANLQKGDKITFLALDRNAYDIAISSDKQPKTNYDPRIFFNKNQAEYIHESGLQGFLKFPFLDTFDPFEFHINYKGWKIASTVKRSCDFGEWAGKHWSEFPPSTPIGYRRLQGCQRSTLNDQYKKLKTSVAILIKIVAVESATQSDSDQKAYRYDL